ncbi:DNA-processing protein DprA [Roseibium sp. SCPC15]|uniref:DNA-processing protein DprA n=1 Tax=Roseibium sp. SCP15 TaxID=3141376 RepID=UPI00333BA018
MSGPSQYKTPRLSEAQRLAWLRLIRSENVGPATFRDLFNHAGSAERALELLPRLSSQGGKKSYRLCSIEDAERELEAHDRFGARLVALGEAEYPQHLKHIDAPPPLLSVMGGTALSHAKTIAIVGARNASLSGRKLAGMFAHELGANGFVLASGLARGIDTAAHEASLRTGTVAVFAGGIDVLYPPENNRLLAAIFENGGTAISEMPFGWKPRGRDFPRRNRLISGVSLGVIVIEAAKKSGSLHTARYALEQNREIFAVPGSPLDPRSEGANGLIRQGATLVTSTADILDEFSGRIGPAPNLQPSLLEHTAERLAAPVEPGDNLRTEILSALGPTPLDMDEIIRFTGAETRAIHVILLELELAGRLERHRGNKISLLM